MMIASHATKRIIIVLSVLALVHCNGIHNILRIFRPFGDDSDIRSQWDTNLNIASGDDNVLILNKDLEYCDFHSLGPVCNLTGVDKELIIPGGTPPYYVLRIEIHNASSVLLNPICLPWVKVYGVKKLRTADSEDEGQFQCRTWLRSYGSQINSLTHGLKDVSLVNSTVDRMNLKGLRDFLAVSSKITVIEHLDWSSYMGLFIDTHINIIEYMNCRDSVSMGGVTIDKIRRGAFHVSHNFMITNRTHFGDVETYGIQVMMGIVTFYNTSFETLQKNAIYSNLGTKLVFKNVTIGTCESPCIVVQEFDDIYFENTSIGGFPIEEMIDSVLKVEEDIQIYPHLSEEQRSRCEGTTDYKCNFSGLHKDSYFTSRNSNISLNSLTLSYANPFHVRELCVDELIIYHSEGSYTNRSFSQDPFSCEKNLTFSTDNTTYHVMDLKQIDSLDMTDCNVDYFTADSIRNFYMSGGAATINGLTVKGTCMWKQVDNRIYKLIIEGELHVLESNLTLKRNRLEIKKNVDTAVISDSTVKIFSNSTSVEGNLTLVNVDLQALTSDGKAHIVLSQDAHLTLRNLTLSNSKYPVMISLYYPNQYEWEDKPENESNIEFVFPTEDDSWSSKYCQRMTESVDSLEGSNGLSCNLAAETDSSDPVIISAKDFPGISHIFIAEAQHVLIHNICGLTVTLRNVTLADAPRLFLRMGCVEEEQLYAYNSNLTTIQGIESFTLENSHLGTLLSFPIFNYLLNRNGTMRTRKSTVGDVYVYTSLVDISDSSVEKFRYVVCKNFWLENSKVTEITNMTVKISGMFKNVVVNRITARIEILGTMHLENVTIISAANKAFNLQPNSILTMKNVVIDEGTNVFSIAQSAYLTADNVTINGNLLQPNFNLNFKGSTTLPVKLSTENELATTSKNSDSPFPSHPPKAGTNSTVDIKAATQPAISSSNGQHSASGMTWVGVTGVVLVFILTLGSVICTTIVVRNYRRGTPIFPQCRHLFGIRREESDLTTFGTEFDLSSTSSPYSRLPST